MEVQYLRDSNVDSECVWSVQLLCIFNFSLEKMTNSNRVLSLELLHFITEWQVRILSKTSERFFFRYVVHFLTGFFHINKRIGVDKKRLKI